MHIHSDILIIGSGAAGLSAALRLANKHDISLISKGILQEGSTLYAQGGIAAVLSENDSNSSHIADTLNAGAGLCDIEVVKYCVQHGAQNIQWLLEQGIQFTTDDKTHDFHLTQEGGHSHRRIVHATDATGRVIERSLEDNARAHPNIDIYENHLAVDLITTEKLGLSGNRCLGAYILDRESGNVNVFSANNIILATGGASKVYLYTSNPDTSTGDGIAMAWRSGCRVANLEFNQFHPTCLFHPKAKSFLLTEALRGEGARLLLENGHRFMPDVDPRAELAPRDIVARAIDHEMKVRGEECVYLDISHKPATFIKEHFPTVYERCKNYGYDLTCEPVPVVPAAHYTCGGIMTDLNAATDIPGLYAVGESAMTGLHGANRMASNSLLECLVFSQAAVNHINQQQNPLEIPDIPEWDASRVTNSDEEVVVTHNWEELRRFMWDYVGIVRTDKRLQRAARRIGLLLGEIDEYYGNFKVNNDLLELRNLAVVADLMIQCAIARKESRGLHYTLNHPEQNTKPANTILTPENYSADFHSRQIVLD